MSCPSWSEPSHSGSSFEQGLGAVSAPGNFCFVERGSTLRVGEEPGRRRRQRRRRVEDRGGIGEADRRPDHPAVRLDLVGDERVAIVSLGLETAEHFLRIVDEDGEEEAPLVRSDQGLVVGDELGAERGDEQHQEDRERPRPAPVATEIVEPAAVHRGECEEGERFSRCAPNPAINGPQALESRVPPLPQLCWGRWRVAPDGCGPLLRPKSDCTAAGVNLHRPALCFPHPIRPSATFPASRRRGADRP